jgi:hypothetical protein
MPNTNQPTPYQEFQISTVDELQDELTRIRRQPGHLLYRGQCADWPLIPSRFRELSDKNPLTTKDLERSLESERHDVIYFATQADQMGFNLPGDLFPLLNRNLCEDMLEAQWDSVSNPWIETIALAQHHGVPSRLLDFTAVAEVALFFAARDTCNRLAQKSESTSSEGFSSFVLWLVSDNYYPLSQCVRRVNVSISSNPYLRAQHAAFLAYELPIVTGSGLLEPDAVNLLEIMKKDNIQLTKTMPGLRDMWPTVVKFKMPVSIAPELMRRLDASGYNSMSMMPNLDSVVRHRKERFEQLPDLLRIHCPSPTNMKRYKFS